MALEIRLNERAWREIQTASDWWAENRIAVPDLFRQELTRAIDLIADHPGIGAPALDTGLEGVRRFYLSRTHYYLYYRVTADTVEILSYWHVSRRRDIGLG